jgi:hypothetical protein
MKKLFFASLLLSLPILLSAQHHWSRPYFEAGGMIGVSNYSGELVNSIVDVKHLHLAGGLFLRYNMNQYLSLRLNGAYGTISGDDANSRDIRNRIRNLHFRSHILDVGVLAEINFMGFNPTGHKKMFSPYAFVGFAVFNYNPKARHFDPNRDGEWVALQPYSTEGQGNAALPNRDPYNMTQLSIPLGLGFKFAVNSHLNIGFEVGFRKTFTDYLDDVALTYPYDVTTNPVSPLYEGGSYSPGQFGDLTEQELMSDRTYEYLVEQAGGTFGADFPTQDAYDQAVLERGGQTQRGDKALDWYLISGVTISYNFIDNGLVKARKRRKRKAGCRSAQF